MDFASESALNPGTSGESSEAVCGEVEADRKPDIPEQYESSISEFVCEFYSSLFLMLIMMCFLMLITNFML
jgi:hypothetical protein